MTLAWHVNFKLSGKEVLAPSRSWRLRFVQRVAHFQDRAEIVAFSLAADHGHVLTLGDRPSAFVHALECSLRWHLDLARPFRRAWFEPVESQSHLRSALHYCLDQVAHHGLAADPLREASNLPDLLGARELFPSTRRRVREYLPRTSRASLVRHFQLEGLDEGRDLSLLTQAGEAACGGPLDGSAPALAIKAAMLRVAVDEGMARATAARRVGVHRTAVARYLRRARPELVRAVKLQLFLIASLAPDTPALADCPLWRPRSRRAVRAAQARSR